MNIVETISGTIQMRTIVGHNAVHFSVEIKEAEEWITVWSKIVKFGMRKDNRAGGYAFQSATYEQERKADNLKEEEREIIKGK